MVLECGEGLHVLAARGGSIYTSLAISKDTDIWSWLDSKEVVRNWFGVMYISVPQRGYECVVIRMWC